MRPDEPTNTVNQYDTVSLTGSAGAASWSLTYDGSDNLSGDGTRFFNHDSRNRLSAYSGATYNGTTGLPTGASATSNIRYDADGRRVSMTDSNGTDLGFNGFGVGPSSPLRGCGRDGAGDMEIADLDLEGGSYNGVLRRYIPGASTDERVALITVNPATGATIAREYYHANRLGSVIAMTSETGAITAEYVYTPYGVESPYNASGNPFRYTGRRLDARWGVYYYRARYYDPQLGRFLETDPAGYADSMNLYAYVGHDPLNIVDPTGRCGSIANVVARADCEQKREQQVPAAVACISSADVSVGQVEDGYIATYNENTGEVTVREGAAAGNQSNGEIQFTDANGNRLQTNTSGAILDSNRQQTGEHLLVTAHSHPQEGGPPNDPTNPDAISQQIDQLNEGVAASPTDASLVQIAPAVVQTPSGAVREFRNSGPCSSGCERVPSTPIPPQQ